MINDEKIRQRRNTRGAVISLQFLEILYNFILIEFYNSWFKEKQKF